MFVMSDKHTRRVRERESYATIITTQYGPRPDSEFTTGTLFIKTRNSNGLDSFAYYHHDEFTTEQAYGGPLTGNLLTRLWSRLLRR